MDSLLSAATEKLLAFKGRLQDVTDRDTILETISNTRTALEEQYHPNVEDLMTFSSENDIKAVEAKNKKLVDIKRGIETALLIKGTWLNHLADVGNIIRDHLDIIEAEVRKTFAKRLISEAASFRQLNILNYVSMLYRFVDNTCKLLYVYIREVVGAITRHPYTCSRGTSEYNAQCIAFVKDNISNIYTHRSDLANAIRSLADADANEETSSMLSSSRPFSMSLGHDNFLASKWNPFFTAYKIYVEYQVKTYNRRKEERQTLILALQQAKEEMSEIPNGEKAKVQRWIESLEGRIEKIDAQVANFEKEYDLNAR